MNSSVIELRNFLFLGQCLNQLRYRMSQFRIDGVKVDKN
jgi:hypothetical protein